MRLQKCSAQLVLLACAFLIALPSGVSAAVKPLAISIDADTMIAFDANSNGAPPPVGSNGSGAFGTGLEQASPLDGLPLTMRGGNPFDSGSLTAKPLIRFDLGPTANVDIDPTLPYFLELTTQTDASSNDTFRMYSIDDPATRSFNEATLTWDNAPSAATASFQDFEAAGSEVGVFFRPNSIDVAGTSIGHPVMGSQLSTFASGPNTFATFGLASTETNRWIVTDQSSPKPPRLITYDVIESSSSGPLTAGGTWTGAANQADTLYRVGSGHTVTIDGASPFVGKGVVVGASTSSGLVGDYDGSGTVSNGDYDAWKLAFGTSVGTAGDGADGNGDGVVNLPDYAIWRDNLGAAAAGGSNVLRFTANNVNLPLIVINGDGAILNDTGTSLAIGDPTLSNDQVHAGGASGSTVNGTAGGLIINTNLTYNALAGAEDLTINMPLISRHDFTFNGVAESDLTLRFPAGHRGTIHFNGSGDDVVIGDSNPTVEDEGIGGTLLMNSSGANRVAFAGRDSEQEQDKGVLVFSQPGTVDHRSNDDGLQGVGNLVANAPVTIDLTKTFPIAGPQADERQFRVTRNLSGAAPIIVAGLPTAPTGTGNTENRFEIGVDAADFTNVLEVDYEGTISTQDFALVQARAGMPNAKVMVNENGILATGFEPHERVPHHLASTTNFGEIELAAESSVGAGDGGTLHVGFIVPTTGQGDHAPQNLRLTTSGGRSGNLTMAAGSHLVMQINGTPDHVPPQPGDPGNCESALQSSCSYDGPVFDTIEVEGVATLGGELVVRLNADVPFQVEPSSTPPGDPDYFPLNIGDTWDLIRAVDGGSITGMFDTLTVIDTLNDLAATQTFEVLYTSPTLVQLRLVDSAAFQAVSVPEPSSWSLVIAAAVLCHLRRPIRPYRDSH